MRELPPPLKNKKIAYQVLTTLALLCVVSGYVGIRAMTTSPILYLDNGIVSDEVISQITKIEDIKINPTDLWKLPAFISPDKEKEWWDKQRQITLVLKNNDFVSIELKENGHNKVSFKARVGEMPITEAIKRVGLMYLIGLIFLFTAISLFRRHPTLAGFLCACFLSASAIYIINVSPVIHSAVTLDVDYLRFLIGLFFVSSTGQIAIVHFSLIFPQPKKFITNHPKAYIICYAYSVFISILYLLGVIAIGTTVPLLVVWISLLMWAFMDALFNEQDPFMKEQIKLSFMAALLVVSFFLVAVIFLDTVGSTLFDSFALFSLMLPFTLVATLDNHYLYYKRLEVEHESGMANERIRRELHDTILNDLASIRIISEGAHHFVDKKPEQAKDRIQQIRSISYEASRQLRSFIWIIDDQHNRWEEILESMRKVGYDLLNPLDISFELYSVYSEPTLDNHPKPLPVIKQVVYKIFREVIINIIKHANADHVTASFSFEADFLHIRVEDDGDGFELGSVGESSYGLENMRRRIKEVGGSISIETEPGSGTKVITHLPLLKVSEP